MVRIPVVITRRGADAEGATLPGLAGTVIDASIAGVGLETEIALEEGEPVSISFATPTMWDPLVVDGVVRWSRADLPKGFRRTLRSGVAFTFQGGPDVLAVFEMLDAS